MKRQTHVLVMLLCACLLLAGIANAEGADRYTYDKEVDLVVVGYGLSGAAAVIEAIDIAPDAEVLLLEKMPEAGGNSIAAGQAILHIYPEDRDVFRTYMAALAEPNPIPEDWFNWWIDEMVDQTTWIDQVADSVGFWFRPKDWGEAIMEFPEMPGSVFRSKSTTLAPKNTDTYMAGGTFLAFQNVVDQLPVEIMYETPATALLQDPDTREIYGVTACGKDGKSFNVRARKGVILACGGYENNLEMQRNFHGMDMVYTTGTPGNTGDGIQMLMQAGAKMWHMKNMTQSGGFWLGIKTPDYESAFLRNFYFSTGGWLEIDCTGNRFYDEATYYHKQHMKMQEYGHWTDVPHWRALPAYFICDEETRLNNTIATTWMAWPISSQGYRWSADNQAEIDKGWIIRADTISELAEKIGQNPAVLQATIDRYNEMCAKGTDEDFGRNPETMGPIEKGPFYAVALTPALVATTGGAMRDTHSRALDWNNNPIPNLYCVGELGSYVSNLYQNGIFLNECITSGRAAAQDAFGVEPHFDYKGNDYVQPLEVNVAEVGGSTSSLSAAVNAKGKKDGEYTASAESLHGPFVVTCVVKDEHMVEIRIDEGRDNMFMTDEQLEAYTRTILEGQSLEVDVIAGATVDSEGIVKAIQLAFSRR